MQHLSKSLFIQGVRCSKLLWLRKNKPEIFKPHSDEVLAIFDTANEVGRLACDLFPDGKRIEYSELSFGERVKQTQSWIDQGVENIYEATFSFDILGFSLGIMVDILHKNSDGAYEIYEVKSSSWGENKKLKDIEKYFPDISFQYYVLNSIGLNVSKASLILLNGDYVRGKIINVDKLFAHKDVTNEVVSFQGNIVSYIADFNNVLSDSNNEPNIDIGHYCGNNKSKNCDARDYCWKTQRNIPEYSVFNIFSLTKNAKSLQLYQQDIVKVEDIPNNFKLTPIQKFYVDSWKLKKNTLDKSKLYDFLNSLTYPVYHFDFETFQQAIPQFEGISPNKQIPFQYSLHIESSDGSLEHKEFLAKSGVDPRESIVKSIVRDIPKDVTVLAFHAQFEKGRLKELASAYPEYLEHLMNIHDNIVDLEEPFSKRYFYLLGMKGKSSIKVLLPLLVPDMEAAYKNLDVVHNGGDAMRIFPMLESMTDKKEVQRMRSGLLEYCKLDTYAMVKLLNVIRDKVL